MNRFIKCLFTIGTKLLNTKCTVKKETSTIHKREFNGLTMMEEWSRKLNRRIDAEGKLIIGSM